MRRCAPFWARKLSRGGQKLSMSKISRAKADSTLRSSRAVPHPSTNRALCRLTSEVRRDPVFSATVWPSAKAMHSLTIIEESHYQHRHFGKKLFTLLDLCVSSLRRGLDNLLCIVPILTDDPRRESGVLCLTVALDCIAIRSCSSSIAFCTSCIAACRYLRAQALLKPCSGSLFDVGGLPLLPFGAMAVKCQ